MGSTSAWVRHWHDWKPKVALRIMLDHYRGITVATDAPIECRDPWLIVSVNKLPLDVRSLSLAPACRSRSPRS